MLLPAQLQASLDSFERSATPTLLNDVLLDFNALSQVFRKHNLRPIDFLSPHALKTVAFTTATFGETARSLKPILNT